MTPHNWVPITSDSRARLTLCASERGRYRRCTRCGIQFDSSGIAAFEKAYPEFADCDYVIVAEVMES